MEPTNPYQPPAAPVADATSSAQGTKQEIPELWLSFQGRIPRRAYWLYIALPILAVHIVARIFDSIIGLHILGPIAGLVMLWPSLAGQAKRWHDRDKSAWWILIVLIPVVGWIWAFVEVGCLRGTTGANRFGGDPTGMY